MEDERGKGFLSVSASVETNELPLGAYALVICADAEQWHSQGAELGLLEHSGICNIGEFAYSRSPAASRA